MRLTRQKLPPNPPRLNMAAMIDIVFLLLVFFMCTTSFAPPEDNLTTNIPQVNSDAMVSPDFEPVRIQLMQVPGASTEDVWANVTIICDGQICPTFEDLTVLLRLRREIADVAVIIDAGDNVAYEHMIAVVDVCRAVGLERVAFAAGEQSP